MNTSRCALRSWSACITRAWKVSYFPFARGPSVVSAAAGFVNGNSRLILATAVPTTSPNFWSLLPYTGIVRNSGITHYPGVRQKRPKVGGCSGNRSGQNQSGIAVDKTCGGGHDRRSPGEREIRNFPSPGYAGAPTAQGTSRGIHPL